VRQATTSIAWSEEADGLQAVSLGTLHAGSCLGPALQLLGSQTTEDTLVVHGPEALPCAARVQGPQGDGLQPVGLLRPGDACGGLPHSLRK
jgi:hypothetical protein